MMVSLAEMAALQEEVGDELDGERLSEGSDANEDEDVSRGENEEDDGLDEIAHELVHDLIDEAAESLRSERPAAGNAELPRNGPEWAALNSEGVPEDERPRAADPDHEKQEPSDGTGSEDMEMDLESQEEGEVSDERQDLAAAKERLMQQLDELNELDEFDELRSRMNMRATLNMILTVAGEFYGQRDLLEFRNPFTGLS
jgi:hypothetical protein